MEWLLTIPWNGCSASVECAETINRYLALSPAAAIAGALWCVHAHASEAFYISPRLAIVSPEKRCGKSTLLRVMHPMLPKPLSAANITVAAVFRTVEAGRPTLLIDEAELIPEGQRGAKRDHQLRPFARRAGYQACRRRPRAPSFSTWCPVAIAAIGGLPGTIEDRSVIIQMRRRRSEEKVARFRVDRVEAQQELGRKAARWTADSARALRDADPAVPTELNDRAADNWRPLLAIADQAGGPWPEKARRAALELSAVKAGEADTMRTLLLADIRGVFAEEKGRPAKERAPHDRPQRDDRSAMADIRQGQMDDAGWHRAPAQTLRNQSGDNPIWRGHGEGLPSFGV